MVPSFQPPNTPNPRPLANTPPIIRTPQKTPHPQPVRSTALIKAFSKSSPILDIVFAYGHFDCEI